MLFFALTLNMPVQVCWYILVLAIFFWLKLYNWDSPIFKQNIMLHQTHRNSEGNFRANILKSTLSVIVKLAECAAPPPTIAGSIEEDIVADAPL